MTPAERKAEEAKEESASKMLAVTALVWIAIIASIAYWMGPAAK